MNRIRLFCGVLAVCTMFGAQAQSLKQASEKQSNSVVKQTDGSRVITIKGIPVTMVQVKGGTFSMGATAEQGESYARDERPVHKVVLSDYYISSCEVTQQLWEAVMGTTVEQQRNKANKDWPLRGVGDMYPMYYVSYNDIQEFLLALNTLTGKNFVLPTEAQWEYAARGGKKSKNHMFSGASSLDTIGWYNGNSSNQVQPVAQQYPNELGIYDMSGNVWEWCRDWYAILTYRKDAKKKTNSNPQGAEMADDIVVRGGSAITDDNSCRVSNRGHMNPEYRNSVTGFRIVLED